MFKIFRSTTSISSDTSKSGNLELEQFLDNDKVFSTYVKALSESLDDKGEKAGFKINMLENLIIFRFLVKRVLIFFRRF